MGASDARPKPETYPFISILTVYCPRRPSVLSSTASARCSMLTPVPSELSSRATNVVTSLATARVSSASTSCSFSTDATLLLNAASRADTCFAVAESAVVRAVVSDPAYADSFRDTPFTAVSSSDRTPSTRCLRSSITLFIRFVSMPEPSAPYKAPLRISCCNALMVFLMSPSSSLLNSDLPGLELPAPAPAPSRVAAALALEFEPTESPRPSKSRSVTALS